MPDLSFHIEKAEPQRFTVAPTLLFKLRIANAAPNETIHSVALRCQIQLEVARRQYTPEDQSHLKDLFGEPDRWSQTLKTMLWTHASVIEAHGEVHLEEISVLCTDTNKTERVPASAMFIFIGALPRTDWLGTLVERDDRGFILTGPDLIWDGKRPKGWTLDRDPFLLETNIPGLFAVGDVRHGSVKRVASGVGEGSVAVQFIHQYLSKV